MVIRGRLIVHAHLPPESIPPASCFTAALPSILFVLATFAACIWLELHVPVRFHIIRNARK
eukprot:COSAG05_NODE_8615_length_687_cov_1.722789_1_plen_60_part_10